VSAFNLKFHRSILVYIRLELNGIDRGENRDFTKFIILFVLS
jgi:hypothetical protein